MLNDCFVIIIALKAKCAVSNYLISHTKSVSGTNGRLLIHVSFIKLVPTQDSLKLYKERERELYDTNETAIKGRKTAAVSSYCGSWRKRRRSRKTRKQNVLNKHK